MPNVTRESNTKQIIIDMDMVIRRISVSEADKNNPAPRTFYCACMINGEETNVSISGFEDNPAEFEKWASLPKGMPFKVRAELHFSEFQGKPGIRLHIPQIMGVPQWLTDMVSAANGNAKKPANGG